MQLKIDDMSRAIADMVARLHEGIEVPESTLEVHARLEEIRTLRHHLTDAEEFLYERLHQITFDPVQA